MRTLLFVCICIAVVFCQNALEFWVVMHETLKFMSNMFSGFSLCQFLSYALSSVISESPLVHATCGRVLTFDEDFLFCLRWSSRFVDVSGVDDGGTWFL